MAIQMRKPEEILNEATENEETVKVYEKTPKTVINFGVIVGSEVGMEITKTKERFRQENEKLKGSGKKYKIPSDKIALMQLLPDVKKAILSIEKQLKFINITCADATSDDVISEEGISEEN